MTLYPSVTCTEMLLITAGRMFVEIVSGISWPLSPLADNVSLKKIKKKDKQKCTPAVTISCTATPSLTNVQVFVFCRKRKYTGAVTNSAVCCRLYVLSSPSPLFTVVMKTRTSQALDESRIFFLIIFVWVHIPFVSASSVPPLNGRSGLQLTVGVMFQLVTLDHLL